MPEYVRICDSVHASWGRVEGDSVVLLDDAPWCNPRETGKVVSYDYDKLLAPARPSKIVLVGLNYLDHIKESKSASKVPEEPVIFMKPLSSIIGPRGIIPFHSGLRRIDYEGEMAAVIGKRIYRATESEAESAIFGYTCLNDVTARELQQKDVQWTRAKSFDGFCPIGPCITTDITPLNLKIETFLNGERRQFSNTGRQIWNVFELVSFISEIMTLVPGDVVSTGTPEGVGPMRPGDVVKVVVEGVGTLVNTVGEK